MIEARNKAWIETEWKRRVRNVIVQEGPNNFRDFNRWYLDHMDNGIYHVEQTTHEIILKWRPPSPVPGLI